MATRVRRKAANTNNETSADPPIPQGPTMEDARQRIQWFTGEKNIDGVRDEAISLANKLELTQHHVKKLREILEKLKGKLDAATACEHYSVVITDVIRNGSVSAEVAGLGNTRVHVAVDPDVDPSQLLIGATGLVSRDRNCLLKVTSPTGRWTEVATFDRQLDSRRVLLRDREAVVAAELADSLRGATLNQGDLIGFDREVSGLAFARIDSPKGENLFDENVTDDFSQLGGLDNEISLIKRHIAFRSRHPGLASKYHLKSKCGILLKGSPGNGKTRIARCCAGYMRRLFPDQTCRFMHISGSADYSMWFGKSEQNIIERFDAVREAARDGTVVMFWDEVDAVGRRRGLDQSGGASDRILNTFLSQLDGVVPLNNVILLYATNRADVLDGGLLRRGRTDEVIEIPAPGRRAADAILRSYLKQFPSEVLEASVDSLVRPLLSRLFSPNGAFAEVAGVRLSDGRRLQVAGRELISGAMLENLVHSSALEAAVREAEMGQGCITGEDLSLALEKELVGAVSVLAANNVKSYVASIPQDAQPIAVEPTLTGMNSGFVRPV